MKIAVSSTGRDLDSQVDPRFGRCAYFAIVETDDMIFEAFDNENIALGGGAGIQSAQFVASKGAKAVITGNCGPNAVQTLSASKVEVFVGHSGTVREVMEKYMSGNIKSTITSNVADHHGMEGGVGMGRGMGRGMEMGRGGKKGMGGGMSTPSAWGGSGQPESTRLSKDEQLKQLKDQAKNLKRQIKDIESSINALEKK